MPKLHLRVHHNSLTPADAESEELLKKHQVGSVVSVSLRKVRNYQFLKKAHALGKMVMENIEGFEVFDNAHDVLKELQRHGNIKCTNYSFKDGLTGEVRNGRIAQSLSFGSMDEVEFTEFYNKLCYFIASTFWPSCSPEKVAEMAEFME